MGRMIVNTFFGSVGLMILGSCLPYTLIARKLNLYSRIPKRQYFKHLCRGWLICSLVYTVISLFMPGVSVIGHNQPNSSRIEDLFYLFVFAFVPLIGYLINKPIVNALSRESVSGGRLE